MKVKELKDILNKFDDENEVLITNDSLKNFAFSIQSVEEGLSPETDDKDNQNVVIIKY